MAKLRSWKDNARERSTNPEYPAELLKGIQNELDNRANPDRAYIKSKIKSLEDFIDNDANFVSEEELHSNEKFSWAKKSRKKGSRKNLAKVV